jgi:HSP20 family protein
MFFAPALKRKTEAAAPERNTFDLGFERFMNDTFGSLVPGMAGLQDDGKTWTLSMDVPGVRKDQLRVNVVGSRVDIETAPEAKRQIRATYELPGEIEVEKSEAHVEDGVLTLTLAKVESALARQIEVR